jgi:methyl-accepting chemotaxis protein WspA
MKKLSVRNRILASLGMILAIMLLIGGFVYSGLSTIERHAWDVKSDTVPGLYRSSLIRDALAADYQLVLSTSTEPNPAAKRQLEQKLDQGRAKLDALIADYRQTISVEADRQAFARFEAAYARHRDGTAAMLSRPLDLSNFQSVRDQFALVHQPRFDAATKAITDVAALNQQRATEMLELVDRESRALLAGIALSFTLAVGLALVVGLGLFRSITTPLARLGGLMDAVRQGDFTQRMEVDRTDEFGDLARGFNRMTDEVMELVGQVQRSGIRVSTSMTEVAATTTQIGATSREIAATSRELVRTMTDVASVADNAASLASSGQSGLAHMEETMGHVMEAASSINAKLAVLNEKAGDINQVVTTITKVADQTNLLSLNAAIEAEKAGEYGRGFAVVSSEIRRLADQTAVATYDIEQMVKEIQSAVSAGVMGMDKFSEEVRRGLHDVHEIGGKLSEIIAQVQALAPRFENVSEGMQAQATGAEQISEALVQLTEATQQTVESLRQSSSAIDELNQVSGNLHGSIARFKLAAA